MTRPMLSRIGRIATKGTAARSKAVRPMKQTGGMTIPVANVNIRSGRQMPSNRGADVYRWWKGTVKKRADYRK